MEMEKQMFEKQMFETMGDRVVDSDLGLAELPPPTVSIREAVPPPLPPLPPPVWDLIRHLSVRSVTMVPGVRSLRNLPVKKSIPPMSPSVPAEVPPVPTAGSKPIPANAVSHGHVENVRNSLRQKLIKSSSKTQRSSTLTVTRWRLLSPLPKWQRPTVFP